MQDANRNKIGVFIVSAYAPTSGSSASEMQAYYDTLATAIARKQGNDVLFVGADANASVGVESHNAGAGAGASAVGPFGLTHLNNHGRTFKSFLQMRELVSVSSHYRKPEYGTWIHPRSKKKHQIDHIIMHACDLKRVKDAGAKAPLLDTDHKSMCCKLRLHVHLRKRRVDVRNKLTKLDTTVLLGQEGEEARTNFAFQVVESLTDQEHVSHATLVETIQAAAEALLPDRPRASPKWFQAHALTLRPLIAARNQAMVAYQNRCCRSSARRLKEARQKVQAAVRAARSGWIVNKCTALNSSFENASHGTKLPWQTAKELKAGMETPRSQAPVKMAKPDGSRAESPEENAKVFADHFKALYGAPEQFDATILDGVKQREVQHGLGLPPTDGEILKAVKSCNNSSPGDSGLSAPMWKSLVETEKGFSLVKDMVMEWWDTEQMPKEWETNLLKILPKKGDLSQPGNHRGIMLLEVAYKIVAKLALQRLDPIKEGLDHESQCGFRRNRGCMDGLFTVKSLVRKRKEHGIQTWLLMLGLVKAFDKVPRELLWKVLLRHGVPPKLVRLLQNMHAMVNVKFEVDGVVVWLRSIIGVKQGDVLGPELFTFFMAAVMGTWRASSSHPLCLLRTAADFKFTGRGHTDCGTNIAISDSEYADDTAVPFLSRSDLVAHTPLLISHFRRWGLEVHVGRGNKKSKSVVLFCSAAPPCYQDFKTFDGVDLSDVVFPDGTHMPVVLEFKYLGSVIASNGRDDADVDARISSASQAFGMLRKPIFASNQVSNFAKHMVYLVVVLSILLYGCECWCLTEATLHKLRCFHAQCARAMCRVNLRHTFLHRISTDTLLSRLGLECMDTYVSRRRLRWLGHMSRMGMERLPRQMLSSWCATKRPRGSPHMTYGRSIKKDMQHFGIDTEKWHMMAENRVWWQSVINSGRVHVDSVGRARQLQPQQQTQQQHWLNCSAAQVQSDKQSNKFPDVQTIIAVLQEQK
jgi:hypothetical protein